MINHFINPKKTLQAAILCSCLFFFGCENDEAEVNRWNIKKVMVDEVRNVQVLFSQGGDLKANLTAPLMLRYPADTIYTELPNKFCTAAVAIVVFGHKAFTPILYFFNSSANPKTIMLIPYLLIV